MSELIARLRKLDTCAVSDALDRLALRGVVEGPRALTTLGTTVGRAVTVLLGPPPSPAPDGPARHLGSAAVDHSGPDDVIVVAHQGRTDCAGWGGLLSRAAARRGVAGIVVDGAARDVAEARAVDLPLYAWAATPVTARGRAVEHSWGLPVTLGDVRVRAGDLVLADEGGVVVLPEERAEEVLTVAERIATTEAAMAEAIESGAPVSEVMGRTYEELTDEQD